MTKSARPLELALVCLLGAVLSPAGMARGEAAFVEGEVIVTFKKTTGNEGARTALQRRSLVLSHKFERLSQRRQKVSGLVREKNRTTAALIAELKEDPSVEAVEPNYIRRISAVNNGDPDFAKLWSLQNTGQTLNGISGTSGVDSGFVSAWGLARVPSSTEVVVAVADTGVDTTHPDLSGNIWVNPGEIPNNSIDDDSNGYVDDVHGYDFALNYGNMGDSGDHGTHVAGTIAATGQNGIGIIGVQHRAKILPLKVSSDGETMSTAAVLSAFDYAIDLKERGVNLVAINASFGGPGSSGTELAAVEGLRNAGIILCAAAGNDGLNNDTTDNYPANYEVSNVIAVAATTQTNGLADFSNYGAANVDLGAPGENIYSTMPLDFVSHVTNLKIGATTYAAAPIDYAAGTGTSGLSKPIHACGLGQPGQFPAGVAGNVALIQRGVITFGEKVANAMAAGAAAVVIYDNTSNAITANPWTLGSIGNWIPAIRISQANGQAIAASALPASSTFTAWANTTAAYQYLDGTSMATPHVAGAVAFAALNFPAETMSQRINRILGNTTPVPALTGKVATGAVLNLRKIIDTDSDGLPDWWEAEEFGNLAVAGGTDSDGDGFNNADEFLAGTDPQDASSRFVFSSVSPGSGADAADLVLSFPSVAGRSYQLERSNNLQTGSWLPLGDPVTGSGGPLELRDADAIPGSARRFYRLSVTP